MCIVCYDNDRPIALKRLVSGIESVTGDMRKVRSGQEFSSKRNKENTKVIIIVGEKQWKLISLQLTILNICKASKACHYMHVYAPLHACIRYQIRHMLSLHVCVSMTCT